MTAFSAVRFRVKPGREQDFLERGCHGRVLLLGSGWTRLALEAPGPDRYRPGHLQAESS